MTRMVIEHELSRCLIYLRRVKVQSIIIITMKIDDRCSTRRRRKEEEETDDDASAEF